VVGGVERFAGGCPLFVGPAVETQGNTPFADGDQGYLFISNLEGEQTTNNRDAGEWPASKLSYQLESQW
jgi:hypothetical protein